MRIDQRQQMGIQPGKGGMGEILARSRKGLGTHRAQQIGLISRVGEKCIEFVLNTGLESGKHRGDQDRKGRMTLGEKGVGLEAGGVEKIAGMKKVSKLDNNFLVLRSS
jgi:hypothetical protein